MNQATDAGLIAYQQGDYTTAFKEWQALAKQGNIQALHNIAILYENGQGVAQNDQLAQEWCQKAAEQGLAVAQSHLAFFLFEQQHIEQAIIWWEKAAQQGNAEAQLQLGLLYYTGQGVPQDNDTAADWFELAAEQGNAEASFNLGVLYANGGRYAHARHWWQKAVEQGSQDAHNALAQLDEISQFNE